MLDNNASSIRVNPVAALTLLLTEAVLTVSADTGSVSLGTLEDEPDKEVVLSFEYDVIDPYGFKKEDFGEQEFGDLLGDILVDIIDKYGTGEQFESDD